MDTVIVRSCPEIAQDSILIVGFGCGYEEARRKAKKGRKKFGYKGFGVFDLRLGCRFQRLVPQMLGNDIFKWLVNHGANTDDAKLLVRKIGVELANVLDDSRRATAVNSVHE